MTHYEVTESTTSYCLCDQHANIEVLKHGNKHLLKRGIMETHILTQTANMGYMRRVAVHTGEGSKQTLQWHFSTRELERDF